MTDREAALVKARKIVRWRYGNHPPENFVRKIADALRRERDEAERECIKALCAVCDTGRMPWYSEEYGWLHGGADWVAHVFYELRRRRAEEG